jgi:hypothetical protein
MMYNRNAGTEPRSSVRSGRAKGAVMMAAMLSLSALIPALADPPKPGALFAHKYNPVHFDTMARADLALMLRAPSFPTLVQTGVNGLPGIITRRDLIGGIHQGKTAVTIGAAAGQPIRFAYRPGGPIILWVGEKSFVTGLLAAQARPLASFVEEGNNGLVGLNDPATRNGKRGYRPKVAGSFIDTEEGYWLLWADAIAEDLFYRVAFDKGEFPDGLTIVDSKQPVAIRTDGSLEVSGGEPSVAFWKHIGEERGAILRCDELGLVMKPRDQDDAKAMETVRRVFKWAPVMRLAAESDRAAFRTFVRELEHVRIATFSTPRLLIEE